jgi:acyl-CoA synthetase (AMP-forming)/AMP-acid ligase II
VLRSGEPVSVLDVVDAGAPRTAVGRALVGCGRPVRDVLVDVVDEQGRSLPDGHFGEIVVRGPTVATVRRDAADRAHVAQADRAHVTGDGGVKIDGELFVVGRLGDGVKVRGEFVDCEGLERRLAAAIGVAAERSALALGQVGTQIHAIFLVRGPAPAADAVARAETVARAVLGDGARLAVHAVAAGKIPKTSSGKVKRREIWNEWAPGLETAPGPEGVEHASARHRG